MARLRHKVAWQILRFPAYLFLMLKFNYTCVQAPKIPYPFILVANHVTDFDPIMVGCSFGQQMYFVASEHLFRRGFVSKLLSWLVAPIARVKGSTDTVSAMNIMRALKHKSNVGLFAEGDKSWDGRTGRLHPTTGRLIKASRAALVTYKLTGGYLTSPRWSKLLRRGKMHGRMVNVYTPDRLAQMTAEEITAAIDADIYEDAYAAQRREHIRYRGKALASGLENALYACPSCAQVCRLKSEGDQFSCTCGLTARFNEYGFFEGEDLPFETVAEWDAWQEQFLRQFALTAGEEPIYEDHGQSLWRIGTDHSESLVTSGTLRLYKDRLTLGGFSVPLGKLYQMGVYGPAHIVFSAEGVNYEIKSGRMRSGRKYLTMYGILTSAASGGGANAANI
ncbi:1-acyl-sn-glycerol-3-phosphate acyltransferase [Sporobacter termitidis DSM 10068]|uniref:1-acyl-sn-glycerol-3-phosphate acyltransferase n=1 Tax=Sporobacter termitidis DSM 10068 TaxID=1123282 RepID=A0A1M5UPZ3_9FIRM|nr:lysophospholipid acyltransferase family protein [Sporobacter termitidis]SHH65071.1 1-acyl-sn-glycerol-3-phosphate acyltransferase [Sporobacter termitidis DSM 10068]